MQGTFTDEIICSGIADFSQWGDAVIINGDEIRKNKQFVGVYLNKISSPTKPVFDMFFIETTLSNGDINLCCEVGLDVDNDFVNTLTDMSKNKNIDTSGFGSVLTFFDEYSDGLIYAISPYVKFNHGVYATRGITAVGTVFIAFDEAGYFLDSVSIDGASIDDDMISRASIQLVVLSGYYLHQKTEIELIDYPRNYRRRVKRKTGKEPSPYFMLKVGNEKRKESERGEYVPTGNKSKAPLHIVRGHFRHTDSHPLPQFNGTFWIPAHTRGDKAHGEIKKGYTIRLPEDKDTTA